MLSQKGGSYHFLTQTAEENGQIHLVPFIAECFGMVAVNTAKGLSFKNINYNIGIRNDMFFVHHRPPRTCTDAATRTTTVQTTVACAVALSASPCSLCLSHTLFPAKDTLARDKDGCKRDPRTQVHLQEQSPTLKFTGQGKMVMR